MLFKRTIEENILSCLLNYSHQNVKIDFSLRQYKEPSQNPKYIVCNND